MPEPINPNPAQMGTDKTPRTVKPLRETLEDIARRRPLRKTATQTPRARAEKR